MKTAHDLNLTADRFYWFADQETQKDAGLAPQGFSNLAEKIDAFAKFNTPTTHSVLGKDGLFLYLYLRHNRFALKPLFHASAAWHIGLWNLRARTQPR